MRTEIPYTSDDPVTAELRSRGMHVTEYVLKPGIVLGGVYQSEASELAYRYDQESREVILIFYKRLTERQGLKSPFIDMNHFAEVCVKAGVLFVKGLVSDIFRGEEGLPRDRLVKYYQRRYNAELLEMEGASRWMRLDMVKYGEKVGLTS